MKVEFSALGRMAKARWLKHFLLTFVLIIALSNAEIHRAKSPNRPSFQKSSFHNERFQPKMSESENTWFIQLWDDFNSKFFGQTYHPWVWSILASLTIGLSGVLPLVIVPIEAGTSLKTGAAAKTLRLLLSFAVGGLLGDVFLHLLPEAWQRMGPERLEDEHWAHVTMGLWVLAGIFTFIIVEMMFEKDEERGKDGDSSESKSSATMSNGCNGVVKQKSAKDCVQNGRSRNGLKESNGHKSGSKHHKGNGSAQSVPHQTRNIAGYLNLLANSIDNFTHGLAVAGSFLVSFKVGILTTFAILIHEIPHEIGDFAILLKSGFNRCEAAKAQLATATVGLAGAIAALSAESAQSLGDRTVWILPFTAGGFLNIALVNVLPDILKEKDPRESVKQMLCLVAGIGIMGGVTLFFG